MAEPELTGTTLEVTFPPSGPISLGFGMVPGESTIVLRIGRDSSDDRTLQVRLAVSRPFDESRAELEALSELLAGTSELIADAAKRARR